MVEPGAPYVHGAHIEVICAHLEAVTRGDIRDLLINQPPRTSKSSLIAVMWPAWEWATSPQRQWLFASYALPLSIRDSVKCRRLIESPWYQNLFGDVFTLVGDQNTKIKFENSANGHRLATSVDGATTGEGGDIIVVDDPSKADEALSDTMRDGVNDWWDNTMSTRLNDPRTGKRVIVMQRLHENDLTGHLLTHGGWTHLRLPMEFEPEHRCVTVALKPGEKPWRDWRNKTGDLLEPVRFGKKEVAKLKSGMSQYAIAGQLQQRPAPAGGGILKTDFFRMWPASKKLPTVEFIVQSYDTSFSEKTSGDYTACTVWGVIATENALTAEEAKKYKITSPMIALLLDVWRERLDYPALRKKTQEEAKLRYGDPGRGADVIVIEEKGSGISLRQDLARAGIVTVPYNPGKADKVMRAHAITHLVEAGLLWLPESENRPGRFKSWCDVLVSECAAFPNADHDDIVDTITQAIAVLRDQSWLRIDPEPEEFYNLRSRENPYGA